MIRELSKDYIKEVNSLVDNKKSKFYEINKRKRNYWNSRSESISCRVRDKNPETNAVQFAMNVRAYLLHEDIRFDIEVRKMMEEIIKRDQHQLRVHAQALFPNESKEFIEKNIGLIIGSLTEEEKANALDLKYVVSCRLLGYEKELFFLKCYAYIKPALMLRCLYHLKYDHSGFIEEIEFEGLGCLKKGINFDIYLDKVSFS